MKRTIGALAVLLFVTSVAIGQQSAFPAAANPSLANNTAEGTHAAYQAGLPSSMALNQTNMSRSDVDRHHFYQSPFPDAAHQNSANAETSDYGMDQHHGIDVSTFPTAANPSENR